MNKTPANAPGPARRWRPSLKRIADECGLTIATVSRILNDKSNFSCTPETAQRVRKVAANHRYMPNQLTRGIRDGRTRSIGVISAERLSFHAEIIHGIHHALAANNYVMIHEWNDATIHTDKGERETVMLRRLLEHRVDGIILSPTNEDATDLYFREVKERGIPLVILDIPLSRIETDFIGTDNVDCGRQAGDFLIRQGHRRLFSLFPSAQTLANSFGERITGLEEVIGSVGDIRYQRLEYAQALTGFSDRSAVMTNNMMDVLEPLFAVPDPVAVFCVNDLIAKDLYRLAKARGKRIPDEISVVGVGNLDFADLLDPPLTSFEQHPYEIGFQAASSVLKRLQEDAPAVPPPVHLALKCDLVARQSVRRISRG